MIQDFQKIEELCPYLLIAVNMVISYMAYMKGIQSYFSTLKLNSLFFKASDVGGAESDAESSLLVQLPRFTYSRYNQIIYEILQFHM